MNVDALLDTSSRLPIVSDALTVDFFSHLQALFWVAVVVYFFPGLWRVLFNRATVQYYDPLKTLVVLGSVKNAMFTVVTLVFGYHDASSPLMENIARVALYVYSMGLSIACVYVVRTYVRNRD
jgi:hypothetical protein